MLLRLHLDMPCISVIMPLYNKELYVERAVRSALSQSFGDFELIVVNDGSTDKGPEIIRGIKDPRIRIVDQINAGISAARNRGIQEAQADLIAFLDADDEWLLNFLETILKLRSSYPQCDVFATMYTYNDGVGNCRLPKVKGLTGNFQEGLLINYFGIAACSDPPLWTSAVSVTKKALNSIGGFPAGLNSGEDLLTWARLAVKYSIAYSIEPCAVFWQAWENPEGHRRLPAVPDIVGRELSLLLENTNVQYVKSLTEYIGRWHTMRASIYFQNKNKSGALHETMLACKYSKINLKLLFFVILAILPSRISFYLFNHMMKIKNKISFKK